MSGERPSFIETWTVRNGRYTVTLTVPSLVPGSLRSACIEWSPQPEKLSDADVMEYRAGRAEAMKRLAQQLGGVVAVVEV